MARYPESCQPDSVMQLSNAEERSEETKARLIMIKSAYRWDVAPVG